mmetsp:Transcript_31672/g.91761  ORF Transcript_31672/g.91761 Transcript_31672/m.91761 type:complete len:100 (-) Transcript_31672:1421-1720(-)
MNEDTICTHTNIHRWTLSARIAQHPNPPKACVNQHTHEGLSPTHHDCLSVCTDLPAAHTKEGLACGSLPITTNSFVATGRAWRRVGGLGVAGRTQPGVL